MENLEKTKLESQRLTQSIKNFDYDEQIEIGQLENQNYEIDFYDENDDIYYYKDVNFTDEFLCFIGEDLVYYRSVLEIFGYKPVRDEDGFEIDKGEEDSHQYIDVIGKNNEIDDQLLTYIETFRDMDEIEKHFEQKPKFLNYIKTNLMSFVKNY
jgi:hypothetical protein